MLDWTRELEGRLAAETVDHLLPFIEAATAPGRHGDWPRWQAALEQLPDVNSSWSIENGVLVAGDCLASPNDLNTLLSEFIPWRKGPLNLAGVPIDTEWRSDWKWNRLVSSMDLTDLRILDIGAGNGYFGYQMLAGGAQQVIACDPTLLFFAQYLAIRHFSGPVNNLLLPIRFEQIPPRADFDCVFSMGVLYHRRDPMAHLRAIMDHLRVDGRLLLETLTIPGDDDGELDPPDRYANMRNVHRLPTVTRLVRWLKAAGYVQVQPLDQTPTTVDEQRSTRWMPFHSLTEALTEEQALTIEGHPPPVRTTMLARKPK